MQTTFTIPTLSPTYPQITFTTPFDPAYALNVGIPVHDKITNHRFPHLLASSCTHQLELQHSLNNASSMLSKTISHKHVEAFWLPPAEIKPISIDTWVGSIEHGANVNCDLISFCPHGSGTHTECVGHISSHSQTILYHMPTTPLPSLILTCHFAPYKAFLESISSSFPISIPINTQYQLDDLVLSGINGFQSSLVSILTRLQNVFKINTDWDSLQLMNITHIDDMLSSIPSQLLQFMRLFSKSIVIRTHLPQCMFIYQKIIKQLSINNENKDNSLENNEILMAIQSKYLELYSKNDSFPIIMSNIDNNTKLLIQDNIKNMVSTTNDEEFSVIFNNTNPPYIPAQFMYILCSLFEPHHILVDLPSVDKENDGGQVLSHKIHFYSTYKSLPLVSRTKSPTSPTSPTFLSTSTSSPLFLTPTMLDFSQNEDIVTSNNNNYQFLHAITPLPEKRTITELCFFPALPLHPHPKASSLPSSSPLLSPSLATTTRINTIGEIALLDLRVAPIESDASPSMPLLYPIEFITP